MSTTEAQSMTDTSTSAATPLLSLRNVDIAFGTPRKPQPTVFDVTFDIWPGETVAVVGESGSGKSTTAMSIMGLLPGGGRVTSGTITFDGRDITHLTEREFAGIRGSEVGLIPQDPMSNLNPVWSIGRHVKEALRANNVARGSAAHSRAVELLQEAGLTEAERRISQYPHQFSGGQRQRALIACGLAARPQLLIADEPTSALDVTVQQQILNHLQGLTEELGTAVLLITHDLGLAAERAQRIIVMSQGRIVEAGPSLEILQDPQHPYTRKLVAAAPSVVARRLDLDASDGSGANDATTPAPNLIEVSGLTKIYQVAGDRPWRKKEFTAAEDVSFSLGRGRTLALVGESGSGKSTVAQMVLGLLEPTRGTVTFDGQDVSRLDKAGELAFRRRVQPVFQNPYGSVDPMYSVFTTIAEPLRIHRVQSSGESREKSSGEPGGAKKFREKRVRELLDLVAMPASMMHRYPGELSGGQRQRVAIARALALEPEALILDEAVSALDVLVQSQILELLSGLQEEMGLTYLFITHDLAVVRQIADETLVMRNGRIVERGKTDALFDAPAQEYTRRLLTSVPGGSLPLYQG